MICSEDEDLDRRLEEYGRHLTVSGWKYKTAKERLVEGAKKDRAKLPNQTRRRKKKKIAECHPKRPQNAVQNSYNQEKSPSSRLVEKEKISHTCTSLLLHRDTSSMGPRTDQGFFLAKKSVTLVAIQKKPLFLYLRGTVDIGP